MGTRTERSRSTAGSVARAGTRAGAKRWPQSDWRSNFREEHRLLQFQFLLKGRMQRSPGRRALSVDSSADLRESFNQGICEAGVTSAPAQRRPERRGCDQLPSDGRTHIPGRVEQFFPANPPVPRIPRALRSTIAPPCAAEHLADFKNPQLAHIVVEVVPCVPQQPPEQGSRAGIACLPWSGSGSPAAPPLAQGNRRKSASPAKLRLTVS